MQSYINFRQADVRTKTIISDKEDHYIETEVSILQEDTRTAAVYALNQTLKHVRQRLVEL